jgi:hypothetical protein
MPFSGPVVEDIAPPKMANMEVYARPHDLQRPLGANISRWHPDPILGRRSKRAMRF